MESSRGSDATWWDTTNWCTSIYSKTPPRSLLPTSILTLPAAPSPDDPRQVGAYGGSYCVKHWNTTQSTIALSSGEAELGGIAYGMAQSIGVQSLCADLGIVVDINLFSHSTAAIGITKRRVL